MIFSDPLLFAFSLLNTGAVLFLLVYFVITLSDLECDYLNAQECCSKLNQWSLPKLIVHGFLSFLFLIHGHWILALLNLPMAFWMVYELASVPSGNLGIYDPTEIHNRGQLKKHMRDCMIHLGYYLLFFFAYLYCMIVALLKSDPINRDDQFEVDS
ncbi:protein cornichon homolog 4 [Tribolium madens]|uniref:protein cornichon homolog 4 n=1 Tax=Tribolium madens TaxID=41895 RepID=UPI001CF754F7|nr:protein cornichon homolog 4 [Tribolium madens]